MKARAVGGAQLGSGQWLANVADRLARNERIDRGSRLHLVKLLRCVSEGGDIRKHLTQRKDGRPKTSKRWLAALDFRLRARAMPASDRAVLADEVAEYWGYADGDVVLRYERGARAACDLVIQSIEAGHQTARWWRGFLAKAHGVHCGG